VEEVATKGALEISSAEFCEVTPCCKSQPSMRRSTGPILSTPDQSMFEPQTWNRQTAGLA
jgi:hypothetical protein